LILLACGQAKAQQEYEKLLRKTYAGSIGDLQVIIASRSIKIVAGPNIPIAGHCF
jgi:hypothetical protein